jgi:hypothetical protein
MIAKSTVIKDRGGKGRAVKAVGLTSGDLRCVPATLALSIDDGDPETLAWAAVTSAFMVGDCESEMKMADRAAALNPNSDVAWHSRGHVYRVAGLPEEAVRSFERATMRLLGWGWPLSSFVALTRPSSQGGKPCVTTPPIRPRIAVSPVPALFDHLVGARE